MQIFWNNLVANNKFEKRLIDDGRGRGENQKNLNSFKAMQIR